MDPNIKDHVFYRTGAKGSPSYDVFFIPGNPGLVSYYDRFLGSIHDQVNSVLKGKNESIAVHGHSLKGFELNDSANRPSLSWDLCDLNGQLKFLESKLQAIASQRDERPEIILIGHSIGAYLLLCLLDEHRRQDKLRGLDYNIAAGICLFPTIVDIALSPAGKRASRVSWIPGSYFFVQVIAWIVMTLLPGWAREALVRGVTGMPKEPARVTAAFLASWHGVAAALYLGHDEFRTVTGDRWGDEIWGSATQKSELYFLFGRNDHWVAETTRDKIIEARGAVKGIDRPGRPKFEVDDTGIPHSFPIRHSQPVAEKVSEYILEVIEEHRAKAV